MDAQRVIALENEITKINDDIEHAKETPIKHAVFMTVQRILFVAMTMLSKILKA